MLVCTNPRHIMLCAYAYLWIQYTYWHLTWFPHCKDQYYKLAYAVVYQSQPYIIGKSMVITLYIHMIVDYLYLLKLNTVLDVTLILTVWRVITDVMSVTAINVYVSHSTDMTALDVDVCMSSYSTMRSLISFISPHLGSACLNDVKWIWWWVFTEFSMIWKLSLSCSCLKC